MDISNSADMANLSIEEFVDKLASAAAVPGGGGAAALAGALGIALGNMVGELTTGKAKYADVEENIQSLMARADALRARLLALIGEDAAAFFPLSKAYSIPKDDPSRDEILERCLKDAAAAPFEILKACSESIDILTEFYEKGSRLMISDAATGAMLAHGAMCGAAVNIRVNTKLMKDRAYADNLNRQTDEILKSSLPAALSIYNDFMGDK